MSNVNCWPGVLLLVFAHNDLDFLSSWQAKQKKSWSKLQAAGKMALKPQVSKAVLIDGILSTCGVCQEAVVSLTVPYSTPSHFRWFYILEVTSVWWKSHETSRKSIQNGSLAHKGMSWLLSWGFRFSETLFLLNQALRISQESVSLSLCESQAIQGAGELGAEFLLRERFSSRFGFQHLCASKLKHQAQKFEIRGYWRSSIPHPGWHSWIEWNGSVQIEFFI